MSARAFYADLGVELPDRGGTNVQVPCFVAPEAHRREDRRPSCSVDVETGAFNCFGCEAKGGPYAAAVARGRSPAQAMELLRRHGLADHGEDRPAPRRRTNRKAATRPSEDERERYRQTLATSRQALERLIKLRGWTPEAIRALELGLDGERVVFPIRDSGGTLVNFLRYEPDPGRRTGGPKIIADKGCQRDLFPAPETLDGREVWIVEGEPDAVAAHTLGLAAVAVPGTGTWRPEWAERFAGRWVLVCLDGDRQGRAAQRIADDLLAHAEEIRIVDLDLEREDGYDLGDVAVEAARDGEAGRARSRHLLARMAAEADALERPKPEDGAALLDDLAAFIRRFVSVTPAQSAVVALWVAHAHAFDASRVTPYLSITSAEPGSGKTLLLEVMALLVPRPWLTGRTTAAVLPRKIERLCPTLLLDESDAAFRGARDYAEALRGVLNSGYKRSGATTVCVGQGANIDFRDFSTYCPKAIAGIGDLPDTVRDRALPIRLERIAPGEQVEEFDEETAEAAAAKLRERLDRFAASSVDWLSGARPDRPDELGPRTKEVTRPLLAIADLAGGDWPRRGRRAIVELRGGELAEDGSTGIQLLADIRDAFETAERDRLSSVEVLEHLCALDEAPWREWRKGRPLSASGLAKLLKPYRIRSRTVRFDDGATAKGYRREQFEDAWKRYLPSTRPPSRHNVTSRMVTGMDADCLPSQDRVVTDAEERENPHGKPDVTDVTATGTGDEPERDFAGADADKLVPIVSGVTYPRTSDRTAGSCNCSRPTSPTYARCLRCDMEAAA